MKNTLKFIQLTKVDLRKNDKNNEYVHITMKALYNTTEVNIVFNTNKEQSVFIENIINKEIYVPELEHRKGVYKYNGAGYAYDYYVLKSNLLVEHGLLPKPTYQKKDPFAEIRKIKESLLLEKNKTVTKEVFENSSFSLESNSPEFINQNNSTTNNDFSVESETFDFVNQNSKKETFDVDDAVAWGE